VVDEVVVIAQEELPERELEGYLHGGAGVCLIFVNAEPGRGPSVHRHPYEEVFVVQEGTATFFIGDEQREVPAGNVVIVPAGTWHGFVNSGDGPLRQLDIHVSPRFVTEWRESGAASQAPTAGARGESPPLIT
jgi:mannose-6-phosphate isomerase-like protein (cupin superfamily)